MTTLRTPPLISLPMTTPPCPCTIVQPVIVMFSHGTRSGEASVPALMVMQSSPTSMWQSLIRTFRHDSGLMPSVLGESGGLVIRTPDTLTSWQSNGVHRPGR